MANYFEGPRPPFEFHDGSGLSFRPVNAVGECTNMTYDAYHNRPPPGLMSLEALYPRADAAARDALRSALQRTVTPLPEFADLLPRPIPGSVGTYPHDTARPQGWSWAPGDQQNGEATAGP